MTTKLTFEQAAEHYMDGIRRGKEAGAISEKHRILDLLANPDFHDAVAYEWKDDKTIYEVISELIIRSDDQKPRYNITKEKAMASASSN